jgi:hypothetical protein
MLALPRLPVLRNTSSTLPIDRLVGLAFGALVAIHFAEPLRCHAQAMFDAPPAGAPNPSVSGVRGLYDPKAMPSGPAGIEAAPAATFASPQTPYDLVADPSQATPAHSALPSGVAPVPIEGAEIVARVDGQVILASDVLWQVRQLIKMARSPIPPEHMAEAEQMLTRQLVMGLIDTKLLYADFRRTVPPENMPKVEESLAKPFEEVEIPRLMGMLKLESRGDLEAALAKSGTSLREVQRQFNEKTIAGEWLRQRIPKPQPITYEELLAYYQDHLKEYEYPAQARWEELMVRFDRCNGDRAEAWRQICAMGNEVWQIVLSLEPTGESQRSDAGVIAVDHPALRGPVFTKVAKERSQGVTASEGGLHDWTNLGDLRCEAINEALTTLKVGQMSDGLESEQGFHIVRVLERKQAGRTQFTEAQAAIRKSLEDEQKSTLLEGELIKLRATARAWTIFDGELNGAQLNEALQQNAAKRR